MANPRLMDELQAGETSEATREELGLDREMWEGLKNFLLTYRDRLADPANDGPDELGRTDPGKPVLEASFETVTTTAQFIGDSFKQLRRAFHILMTMSVVTFCIGVSFLVIAAIRSFTEPEEAASTAVVAGVGIVPIVALFLRNPLERVELAAARAQSARIAIMSYMLGVGLVGESVYGGRRTADELARLSAITEDALRRLDPDLQRHDGDPPSAHDPEG